MWVTEMSRNTIIIGINVGNGMLLSAEVSPMVQNWSVGLKMGDPQSATLNSRGRGTSGSSAT